MPPVNTPGPTPPPRGRPKVQTPKVNAEKVQQERTEAVAGLFQIASALCIATGQLADAAAINMHGEAVSRETAALASKYEKVGNVLDGLSQVGPFTAILAATMPLFIQIAVNHKRISPEKGVAFGAKSPSILDGQMRMAMRQQQAAAEQQLREEEEFYRQMEEEKVAA
jgi:hypothetical protein